jgi:cytochrome c biogenesis factor
MRRLGLDGNPLRRRNDKIAARLAALLVLAFLIGAPLLSLVAVGWAGRAAAAEQAAMRSWRRISAVLLQAAPPPAAAGGIWAFPESGPGGSHRAGRRGPAGSQSARTWPRAARSGCG